MIGGFELNVKAGPREYSLYLRRNITIIRGDSATGKSTLLEDIAVLQKENRYGSIQCKYDVELLQSDFEFSISKIRSSVDTVFLGDEDIEYYGTKEFAEALKESGNFVVIMSRRNFEKLPYSINDIYSLKSSTKIVNQKQVSITKLVPDILYKLNKYYLLKT